MATIRPFRSIRPVPALASQVAALPYDVMNSEEARAMVQGNPYSFLHVDKAEIDLDPAIDVHAPQVYEKARDNLQKMIADHIYLQEDAPAYYLYRLIMNGRSQTGLVVTTSIDEYLDNTIKKHEFTRPDKEQDRIHHVDYCDANTGPIFMTYRNQPEIKTISAQWTEQHAPVYDFTAEDGIQHTIWTVDDAAVIEQLTEAFAAVPSLYIADGHHRTASAVKVGLKRREAHPGYTGEEEFNYFLSVVFPDDELVILDYNRVIKDLNGLTATELLEALQKDFAVFKSADAIAAKPQTAHTFAMYLEGQWYRLTYLGNRHFPDTITGLDVSVLQTKILTPILGIGDPRTDKRIDFVGGIRGLAELEKRVDSGEMQVAFALYPTSIAQLMQIADENNVMPPKSTWFEPKLRSGLFIHPLQ